MDTKKRIDWKQALQIGCILFLVLFVFGNHCPIEHVIGIPCPGCNMFSALYWLFHGDFKSAYFFHPGVFLLVPYILFMGAGYWRKGSQVFSLRIYKCVTILFFGCLILIYIWRMITIFPDYPMQFNSRSFLYQIIQKMLY
ncbi:DUF2752 domain-containing protein [Erysipelotrichaceae bacterium HCN-30851]